MKGSFVDFASLQGVTFIVTVSKPTSAALYETSFLCSSVVSGKIEVDGTYLVIKE